MLIWMREGAGGKVVKIILLSMMTMAVAGLVLMDVGGFFRSDMNSNTVVKGGGVKISTIEFDRLLHRVLASQNMDAAEAYRLGVVNRVLEGEVQNRIFTQEARKLGLHVSDTAVATQISQMAEQLATEGRSKKEALQQALRNQRISEGEFVTSLRYEIANTLLRNALSAPATLSSPLLAQNLYRYDNEKRSAKVIVLSNDSITDIAPATEENLKKFYELNKAQYAIAETRTVTMATLKPSMLKKESTVTDEDLQAEYDKNIASFTKPARRLLEQSVLKTEDEAKVVAESLKGGKSMKESASKDAYMGEQEFEENGLLPEIAKPVFSAKEADVVGPVQTSLGWHVLVVKKILPESVTPFAQVKDKLAEELKQIAGTDAMFEAGNVIEDRIAGGDKLEDLVKEYGMTTEVIGPFRRNGMDKDNKDLFKPYATDRDKLIQAAYDYDEGENTNIVETADGQFHVLHIDTVVPDSYLDFASVKDSIAKRWVTDQKKSANKARAAKVLEEINAGKSLEDAAQENKTGFREVNGINRKDTPESPLTPIAAAQVFATEKGKNFSSEIDNGYIVGQVTNVTLPDHVKMDSKELKDLDALVGNTLQQDILAQYITNLMEGKKIEINQRQLENLYGKSQNAAQ